MSHYDCRSCGEYGCTEADCMSAEKIAARKQKELNREISRHREILNKLYNEKMSPVYSREFLIKHNAYDPALDILFKDD